MFFGKIKLKPITKKKKRLFLHTKRLLVVGMIIPP
ncbi:hypothetical protein HCCG_00218 [Helicobacter cinaedi CCUG 18818 = ATCC BAA-847]|uniref:Uncharacterized protein n=1 Tax=Helicobacter cinaedi CCUG 18818 = ATCC BAA-847 TaxID=537971 RepID=A0ABN0B880_9HELI|nr:hypothetical protein HCCG_00218 [Helicobacter cinaedi CCUG 18818 = ATCC BAA-847]